MNYEIKTEINDLPANIYLQSGFFDHENIPFPFHSHSFPEIHIFLSGQAILKYENTEISVNAGDVCLVPDNVYHIYNYIAPGSRRITFLIDTPMICTSIRCAKFPVTLEPLLCHEIQLFSRTGVDNRMKSLISYICAPLFESENKPLIPVKNRQFIINEFFAKKYNTDVTLYDLAQELCLGIKQTEREVKKYTGNSFRDELRRKRIEMANILMKTTDFPLTKISELVGYTTYSGFFKATSQFNGREKE